MILINNETHIVAMNITNNNITVIYSLIIAKYRIVPYLWIMNDPVDLATKLINFYLASQTPTRSIIVPVNNYIFLSSKDLIWSCTPFVAPMAFKNQQILEKSNKM